MSKHILPTFVTVCLYDSYSILIKHKEWGVIIIDHNTYDDYFFIFNVMLFINLDSIPTNK